MQYLKTVTVVLFLWGLVDTACAQYNNHIPSFRIALTDSSYFNSKQLKKNEPLLLVYFSPNCDHCKKFTDSLVANINSFKNIQIVMMSYFSLDEIKKFEKAYHLTKFTNVKTGTEGYTFKVLKFYNISQFPFVAVFNSKGILQKTFVEDVPMQSLIKTF
jgi:peroxiredoxin